MHLRYLALGAVCILAAGLVGMGLHSIGMARAKSREAIPIYTEEELSRYLLDKESEDYNRNGRYRLEADLALGWLEEYIGTNIEPFTGKFDGNGQVISGLTRPLFGVLELSLIHIYHCIQLLYLPHSRFGRDRSPHLCRRSGRHPGRTYQSREQLFLRHA